MISFNDYNLIESCLLDENFQILLTEALGNKVDDTIKFGIVMATHKFL